MQHTTNFGFNKAEKSDAGTDWLNSLNANWEKLDAMPLPTATSKNTQLYYQKFVDGTLHMWGSIDYGSNKAYECHTRWATGYASDDVKINFPVEMTDTEYSIVAFVQTDKNPDMWCVSNGREKDRFGFNFLCGINESTSTEGINAKRLNLDIWGRWEE